MIDGDGADGEFGVNAFESGRGFDGELEVIVDAGSIGHSRLFVQKGDRGGRSHQVRGCNEEKMYWLVQSSLTQEALAIDDSSFKKEIGVGVTKKASVLREMI